MAIDDMLVKLKALQAGFGQKLPARLAAIDAALQDCRDQPQLREHVETLHRLLHTMAGSAGTFGFDALGLRAREFEQEVKGWLAADRWCERDLDRLALLLPELRLFIEQDGQDGPDRQDGMPQNSTPAGDDRATWIAFDKKPDTGDDN